MSRNTTKRLIKHRGILLLVIVCCVFSCFAGARAATKKPKLSKKNVTLKVGKSVKIKVLHVSKKRKIKWSVKNKKIATVKNGKITAKKKGKTKVYAVVDKKKLVCNVNVKSAG
ncbi:MAG: Ig-like domain-containing protein [Lachnospiraceae bacterium]|nr:Ig-like domain-containing protein [Lachnospiraceae bacterium]